MGTLWGHRKGKESVFGRGGLGASRLADDQAQCKHGDYRVALGVFLLVSSHPKAERVYILLNNSEVSLAHSAKPENILFLLLLAKLFNKLYKSAYSRRHFIRTNERCR